MLAVLISRDNKKIVKDIHDVNKAGVVYTTDPFGASARVFRYHGTYHGSDMTAVDGKMVPMFIEVDALQVHGLVFE